MIAADYDNGIYTSLALKFFSIVREASSFSVNHSTHNLSLSLVDVDLLVEDDSAYMCKIPKKVYISLIIVIRPIVTTVFIHGHSHYKIKEFFILFFKYYEIFYRNILNLFSIQIFFFLF